MDQLIRYLPDFNVFVCLPCSYAVNPHKIDKHLQKVHRYEKARIRTILADLGQDPGHVQASIPPVLTHHVPELHLFSDGLLCRFEPETCRYICRTKKSMTTHLSTVHQYSIHGRSGRPTEASRLHRPGHGFSPIWDTVACQKFFEYGPGSSYVEVTLPPQRELHPPLEDGLVRLESARAARMQQLAEIVDERTDRPSPWILKTRWVTLLGHKSRAAMAALVELPATSRTDADGASDVRLVQAVARLATKSQKTTEDATHFVRMLVVATSKESTQPGYHGVRPIEPYQSTRDLQANARYWQKIVLFFVRSWRRMKESAADSPDLPSYTLTKHQSRCLDTLIRDLGRGDSDDGDGGADGDPPRLRTLELSCLRFCMSTLRIKINASEADSCLLHAVAALGIQGTGWMQTDKAPSMISGILKIARFFLVRSVLEDGMEKGLQPPLQVDDVRKAVEEVMVRGTLSPVNWLMDLRAYGMRQARDTTAEAHISWDGDTVLFKSFQLPMTSFRRLVHGLHHQLSELLDRDILLWTGDRALLPYVSVPTLRDDASNTTAWHYFALDRRNNLPVDGQTWFLSRLRTDPYCRERFFSRRSSGLNAARTSSYIDAVRKFLDRLFVLVHLTYGQPARTSEMCTVRYRNHQDGEGRGILIDRGSVVFRTSYNKTFSSTGKPKVIYRYVPEEVGSIVVRYLWLVAPFVESLESQLQMRTAMSTFLWTKQDRLRNSVQAEFHRHTGQQLGTSVYRHIAVAISRRFLKPEHMFSEAAVDAVRAEDFIDNDEFLAEQAGHSALTRSTRYALLQDDVSDVLKRQERFYTGSREFHRFEMWPSCKGLNDNVETPWNQDASRTQEQRFATLRGADLQAQLRLFYKDDDATFRPGQHEAITAVVRGQSPILAVLPTGGGKSLLAMLPSWMDSTGTTVLVVPLLTLRADLQRRCTESGIDCRIWDPMRPPDGASIVLVTPEAAVQSSFSAFLNRLRAMKRLDRIILDECHVFLDRQNVDFRPLLNQASLFSQSGVQLVFLTATMIVRLQHELWERFHLQDVTPTVVRVSTVRPSIRYGVTGPMLYHLVAERIRSHHEKVERRRTIVYRRTKAEVESLAERLGCPYYHSDVKDKDAQLDRFLRGEDGIIVTTGALGLGVDVPDVRLVVHVGLPWSLTDFAQESGRLCRDGRTGMSYVIPLLGQGEHDLDADLREYLSDTLSCRRTVLDRVFDGDDTRTRCGEHEKSCDLCDQEDKRSRPGMRREVSPRAETSPSKRQRHRERQHTPESEADGRTTAHPSPSTADRTGGIREESRVQVPRTQESSPSERQRRRQRPDTRGRSPTDHADGRTRVHPRPLVASYTDGSRDDPRPYVPRTQESSPSERQQQRLRPDTRGGSSDGHADGRTTVRPRPPVVNHAGDTGENLRAEVLRAQSRYNVVRQSAQDSQGNMAARLDRALDLMGRLRGYCVACYLLRDSSMERSEDCDDTVHRTTLADPHRLKTSINFERYSGCFSCAVPQSICHRYEKGDKGYIRTAEGCQFGEELFRYGAVLLEGELWGAGVRRELMDKVGIRGEDESQAIRLYFQKKVRWIKLEASGLFRCVFELLTWDGVQRSRQVGI